MYIQINKNSLVTIFEKGQCSGTILGSVTSCLQYLEIITFGQLYKPMEFTLPLHF